MRFLRLWFLLASSYLGIRLVSSFWISGAFGLDGRFWVHAAVIPLLQAAALAPLLSHWAGRRAAGDSPSLPRAG